MEGPGPNGGLLPPTDSESGTGTTMDSLDSTKKKLELQDEECKGKRSIYSHTRYTPEAILNTPEKELLAKVVKNDVLQGNSGPFNTHNKTEELTGHKELRVVRPTYGEKPN